MRSSASGAGSPTFPEVKRPRTSRRRVWNSVQFEVEVSSLQVPWDGNHASQSYLREAEAPRAPEATSSMAIMAAGERTISRNSRLIHRIIRLE